MWEESVTKVSFFCIMVPSVLLFSNCKVATSTFHHVGGVCYQGKFFVTIV